MLRKLILGLVGAATAIILLPVAIISSLYVYLITAAKKIEEAIKEE